MNKYFLGLGVVVLICILGGLYFNSTGLFVLSEPSNNIVIGVSLPLSGGAASLGDNALAGIELAVNEANSNGGINGKMVSLVIEDDKCSSESVTAVKKILDTDNLVGIVGFICSAAARPALPLIVEKNIPVLLVSASASDLTSLGKNIFRIYPNDDFEGKKVAEFALKSFGKKAAVIYVKDAWGESISNSFKTNFTQKGGEVIFVEGVLPTEIDFKANISKIKSLGVDFVFLPLRPDNGLIAVKQIKELDLNAPILGGDFFEADEFILDPAAEGVLFVAANANVPIEFVDKVHALSGYEDLQPNFALTIAYDSTKALLKAISVSTTNSDAIFALRQISFEGVSTSIVEFDSMGEVKEPASAIKIVRGGKAVLFEK